MIQAISIVKLQIEVVLMIVNVMDITLVWVIPLALTVELLIINQLIHQTLVHLTVIAKELSLA